MVSRLSDNKLFKINIERILSEMGIVSTGAKPIPVKGFVLPTENVLGQPISAGDYMILTQGTYTGQAGPVVVPANSIGIVVAESSGNSYSWVVRSIELPSTPIGPNGAASYETVEDLLQEVEAISSFIGEATESKIDIPISSFTRFQGMLVKTDGNTESDASMSYLQLNVSAYSVLEFSGRIMTWLNQDSVNARARAYLYDPFSPLFITAIPSRLGADTNERETVILDVSRFTLLTINVKNDRFVADDLKLSTFEGDSLEARIKAVITPPSSPQSVAPIPNQPGVIDAAGNVGTDPNSRWSGYIPVSSVADYIYYGADKAFYGAFYNASQEPIRAFINYPYSFHEVVEGAAYFGVNTANQGGSIDYANSRIGFIPKLFQGYISQQKLQEAVRMAKHTNTAEWVGEFIVDVGRDFINGATPQARIQSALDFAEGRKITVYLGENYQSSSKTWNIESSLLIGNNTALIIGEGVRIKFAKNEVVDTIIRSKNIQTIPGAALHSRAYMEGRLRADEIENIVVLGSGIDKTFIEGSDIPYTAPLESGGAAIPWIGDPFGWRTISVLLVRVKNVEVGGYAISKTKCWGTLFEHCTNFWGHDIKTDSAVGTNGDGCNALGGSTFGVMERISGTTGDDTVFVGNINRAPENYPAPRHSYPPYQYSMLVMHNINREQPTSFQDVHDVLVNDISGNSWGKQVRIMATNGSKVSKIKVNKIYQTNGPNAGGQGTVAIELNYDQHTNGIADDILLNNIKADIAQGATLQISSGATNVVANNIRGDGTNPAVSGGASDTILTNIFPA